MLDEAILGRTGTDVCLGIISEVTLCRSGDVYNNAPDAIGSVRLGRLGDWDASGECLDDGTAGARDFSLVRRDSPGRGSCTKVPGSTFGVSHVGCTRADIQSLSPGAARILAFH